jgi:hypothetical protein
LAFLIKANAEVKSVFLLGLTRLRGVHDRVLCIQEGGGGP